MYPRIMSDFGNSISSPHCRRGMKFWVSVTYVRATQCSCLCISLRICLLLELWLLRHPEHFVEDQHLKEELMAFIEEGILAFPNKEQELNKIRNMVVVVTQHCSPTSKNCHDEEETEQQEAEESPEHVRVIVFLTTPSCARELHWQYFLGGQHYWWTGLFKVYSARHTQIGQ